MSMTYCEDIGYNSFESTRARGSVVRAVRPITTTVKGSPAASLSKPKIGGAMAAPDDNGGVKQTKNTRRMGR